jgi:hypothetical protein
VPDDLPVGLGRLVEEQGTDVEASRSQHGLGRRSHRPRASDVTDLGDGLEEIANTATSPGLGVGGDGNERREQRLEGVAKHGLREDGEAFLFETCGPSLVHPASS